MEINKKPYALLSLKGLENKINERSDYQRLPVWTKKQKESLIDSIMRGYDIPKVYAKKEAPDSEFEFEIIDGQQRLRAIWEFFNDEFTLPRDADPINGIKCAGHKYSKLDISLRTAFDMYGIDFVTITDAIQNEDKDEIGELFLRLQNGTPLNHQEKRNAMPGKMRDFVKDLATHSFFSQSSNLKNNRYSFDQLAAQMTILELADGPTNISASELDKMYKDSKDFDATGKIAKKVIKVLNYLHQAFPQKTPELARHSIITLYCLASKLIRLYAYEGTEEKLGEWFITFEAERVANEAREEEQKDIILVDYKNWIGNSSDNKSRIENRLKVMEERFFGAVSDIMQRDENRLFSHEQRLAIFRRDKAKCQICGKDLDWDSDFEADHITPHSKGGKTIVSNGQATCKSCNASKSDKQ